MPAKVYYNSACPVCNAGIKNQRQRMQLCGIKNIEWVDVHNNPDMVSETGNPLEQVRERLHLKDDSGELHIGIDAFIHLWQRTPNQRWLAKLLQLPVIGSLARYAYNGFARLLYCWNRALKHW
jgi:predicted DCC family thiol-disulfide oxidoreductase YuxK